MIPIEIYWLARQYLKITFQDKDIKYDIQEIHKLLNEENAEEAKESTL